MVAEINKYQTGDIQLRAAILKKGDQLFCWIGLYLQSMSEVSNSIVTLKNDEDTINEEAIIIKYFYKQEIYHGSALKSRFELSKYAQLPIPTVPSKQPATKGNESSVLPVETNDSLKNSNSEVKSKVKKPKSTKIKKYNISKSTKGEKQNNFYRFTNMLIVFSMVAFIAVMVPFLPKLYHNAPIPIDKVQTELQINLLNQDSSIATLIDSLRELHHEPPKKILTSLVGPTGVGKSHLINILSKEIISFSIKVFQNSDLQDLCNESSSISMELGMKVILSKFFVIVIDDLKLSDIEILKIFVEMTFSRKHSRILILTIFNLETEDCLGNSSGSLTNPDLIKDNLGHLGDKFYLNSFNYLNGTIAKLWLKKALAAQNFKFDFDDTMIENLLERHDVKCHGLKGLHSKLLLLVSEKLDNLKKKQT